MSADQRDPTSLPSIDGRCRNAGTDPSLEPSPWADRPPQHSSTDADRLEPPLAYRIERTRLRTRIAALERAVETSERRRQEVIDQYERVLRNRDETNDVTVPSEPAGPLALLSRLIGQ